jgi:serine phosphatase RsbU (regulator of sigma subunit)
MPTELEPAPKRRLPLGSAGLVWLVALVTVIAISNLRPTLAAIRLDTAARFVSFAGWLVLIALSLYFITLAIRWTMRKLFWRVGRRLFLSYVLIGLLPFILMAILLLAIGYMIAGVMSQAALRGERQATLGQMESWALEYGLTGRKPGDALPSLEIYDSEAPTGQTLPEWLRKSSFSGMVWRDREAVLVASRQFSQEETNAGTKTIVLVQPLDDAWVQQLEDKGGMIVRVAKQTDEKTKEAKRKGRIRVEKGEDHADFEGPEDIDDLFIKNFARKIIWGDLTTMTDWERGEEDASHRAFTFIVNPFRNLFLFYFGNTGGTYIEVLAKIILGLTVMLMIIYLFAALFAAVLIFSISRAVNRIEKGTKAVERGDFTYRIRMKPHNQLGEMAQSFDHMTESIASLLTTVAEKERLQSEIEIAATIQRNLLPKEGPRFRGVSFAAHFEPTTSIGGDYYDVFNIDKTRLAVAIGDVSGHGLSTGLVMAMVKAAMTTLVEEGTDEVALFHRLNDLVYRSTERRAFMTLAFTIFDLERGTIRHTNAGHLYPYLLRKGQGSVIALESPSLPLGVRSEITSETYETQLEEGDTVVYLSDGIVEAQDVHGDPFGFDHLEKLLGEQTDRSPNAVRDAILSAVAMHSGTRPADDDRTVMVVRFDNIGTTYFSSAEPVVPAIAEG